jgi:hypothetical protein
MSNFQIAKNLLSESLDILEKLDDEIMYDHYYQFLTSCKPYISDDISKNFKMCFEFLDDEDDFIEFKNSDGLTSSVHFEISVFEILKKISNPYFTSDLPLKDCIYFKKNVLNLIKQITENYKNLCNPEEIKINDLIQNNGHLLKYLKNVGILKDDNIEKLLNMDFTDFLKNPEDCKEEQHKDYALFREMIKEILRSYGFGEEFYGEKTFWITYKNLTS